MQQAPYPVYPTFPAVCRHISEPLLFRHSFQYSLPEPGPEYYHGSLLLPMASPQRSYKKVRNQMDNLPFPVHPEWFQSNDNRHKYPPHNPHNPWIHGSSPRRDNPAKIWQGYQKACRRDSLLLTEVPLLQFLLPCRPEKQTIRKK